MPLYVSILAYWIIILAVAGIFISVNKEKYSFLKTIHREQKIGSLIAALALGWSGWQGHQLLGQDFPTIAGVIPILVPALIVGVYLLMDYVFTRALGGLLIMLICDILFQIQDFDVAGRFVVSLIAYVFAIIGMYMIGQPWRFRDLLFKSIETPAFGKRVALITLGLSVAMFIPVGLACV